MLGEYHQASEIYKNILETDVMYKHPNNRLFRLEQRSTLDVRGKLLIAVWDDTLLLLNYKNPENEFINDNNGHSLYEISFSQGHNTQGIEYAQKNRLVAAEEEFTLSLQLDASLTASLNNLGLVYLKQKKYNEAKHAFSEIIAKDPKNYVAYFNHAVCSFLLNNLEEAVNYFEKALKFDSELSEYALNFADILIKKNFYKEAIEILHRISNDSIIHECAAKRLQKFGIIDSIDCLDE